MPADRLRSALLVVWLAASALLVAALAVPLLLPDEALAVLLPECPQRLRTGRPCLACGAAASLLLISGGRVNAAMRESVLGIPLYATLIWNECLVFLYTAGELRWFWTQLRRVKKRTRTEEYSCRP